MSLFARYNNWLLGGLIGHPELTTAQWWAIRKLALERFGFRGRLVFGLSFGCLTMIPFFFGIDALVTSLGFDRFGWQKSLLQFCSVVILITLAQGFMCRFMPNRHIRAAANELGLVKVCLACGYDLKGSSGREGEAEVCPECGKTDPACVITVVEDGSKTKGRPI